MNLGYIISLQYNININIKKYKNYKKYSTIFNNLLIIHGSFTIPLNSKHCKNSKNIISKQNLNNNIFKT